MLLLDGGHGLRQSYSPVPCETTRRYRLYLREWSVVRKKIADTKEYGKSGVIERPRGTAVQQGANGRRHHDARIIRVIEQRVHSIPVVAHDELFAVPGPLSKDSVAI